MRELQKKFYSETSFDINDILTGDRNVEYIRWLENKINGLDNLLTEDEILKESKLRQLDGAEPFSWAGGARWAKKTLLQ